MESIEELSEIVRNLKIGESTPKIGGWGNLAKRVDEKSWDCYQNDLYLETYNSPEDVSKWLLSEFQD